MGAGHEQSRFCDADPARTRAGSPQQDRLRGLREAAQAAFVTLLMP